MNIFFLGLPLGIYTNHWHRTVNMAKSGLYGDSCQGFDAGGRCPRSSEYVPDLDYDLQGIFEVEDIMPHLMKMAASDDGHESDLHFLR